MATNKLKLMIVDDEYLIRELLKKRINWDEFGMEIVCEASSAYEALDMVEEFMPDIIFTDICMPAMDGIEFSRIVIERHPNIRIVVLTGHDEFEYAKRSIKVGISDFLLKPINGQEIKKVVLSLKQKLEFERNNSYEFEKLKKQLKENLPYLKEKFLYELLQKDLELDEIKDTISYYKLNFNMDYDYYQAVIIEVSSSDSNKNLGEEQKIMLEMQCKDILIQYFRNDIFIFIFSENDKRIAILSNDESIDISECCEAIKVLVINRLKCFINIGIGNMVKGLRNIRYSYKEACDALDYKIIVGKNQIVSYNELAFSAKKQWIIQPNTTEKLKFYIKAGLENKTELLIDDLFKEFGNIQSYTIDRIRLVSFDVVLACLHVLSELGINISDVWTDKIQPYDYIFKADTLPEIKMCLKDLTLNIISKINSLNSKKVNIVIKQIKEYIEINLENSDISLSGIAKIFYLNQSHLSRLFKQETGQTIVEYITKVRIEKAIELLRKTDMKVYQVGEKVGICDSHYFSIVFKKFTGLSINDFRKK
ncbi:MAG TPA: response regulator [Ruminiclostridium sp.]